MDYLKLPNIVKTSVSNIYQDQIYNGKYDFTLNHNLGDLYQCFIKATLSTNLTANGLQSYFGLKVLKSIRLHNNKSTIALCNTWSMIARMDLLIGTVLGNKISYAITPQTGAFLNNQFVTVFIPVMFFFSDRLTDALDLAGRDQLYIEIVTNDNKGAMGMATDFTSAKYELISYYRKPLEVRTVPKALKDSYSVFNEQPLFCLAGSTSAKILMTCPYPTFYVHFLVQTATTVKANVTNVKIDIPNMTIMDIDTNMNYLMSETTTADVVSSTTSIQFGERHNDEKKFVKFSQEMTPTYVTLTFAVPLIGDSYLYTTCEYYTNLVTDKGLIINDVSGLFYTI